MIVVIWKSYGDIEVYEADTTENLRNIVKMIINSLEHYGLDEEIKKVKDHLQKHGDEYEAVRSTFPI